MKTWKHSGIDLTNPGVKSLGEIEFQSNNGEWHSFTCYYHGGKIIFGGWANACFLESGYIDCDRGFEGIAETLAELLADLEAYYNDGPAYVSRIVCNQRM